MDKWIAREAYTRNAVQSILNSMEEDGYEFKAITANSTRGSVDYTLVFRKFDTDETNSWAIVTSQVGIDEIETVAAPNPN